MSDEPHIIKFSQPGDYPRLAKLPYKNIRKYPLFGCHRERGMWWVRAGAFGLKWCHILKHDRLWSERQPTWSTFRWGPWWFKLWHPWN